MAEIKFEQIVTVKPAYDCEVIQPCVHGSTRCGNEGSDAVWAWLETAYRERYLEGGVSDGG